MNRPSVARTCSHCDIPIDDAKKLRFFEGRPVSDGCLRALAAANANAAAMLDAPSSTRKLGDGAKRALERRQKDAEANAKLRAARHERAVLADSNPRETTTT